MSKLGRYYSPGQSYFVTSVMCERKPVLAGNETLLKSALDKHLVTPSAMVAWVILPDHFHAVIEPADRDLSLLMRRIKLSFSAGYRLKQNLKMARLWQLRFWDHIIRDEEDLRRHLDYIHYNPVKHGIVGSPHEYRYSSFGEFLKRGQYVPEWGKSEVDFVGEFGE